MFKEENLKNIPVQLLEAQKERIRIKEQLDEIVLETIKIYPGKSLMWLQNYLKITKNKKLKRTFLINSLKRLEDDSLVFSSTGPSAKHGKIAKNYYYNYDNDKTKFEYYEDELIPFIDDINDWLSEPMAYATKYNEIILGKHNDNSIKCEFKLPLIVEKNKKDKKIILKLPNRIKDFYHLLRGTFDFKSSFTKNKIILTKIVNIKSSDEKKKKKSKLILVLEDDPDFAEDYVNALENAGHKVKFAKNLNDFKKIIRNTKKKFDFISIDNRIRDKNVANKLFSEISYSSPDSEVGLYSKNFSTEEVKHFQERGFVCIIPKKPKRRFGRVRIGQEIIKYLEF